MGNYIFYNNRRLVGVEYHIGGGWEKVKGFWGKGLMTGLMAG